MQKEQVNPALELETTLLIDEETGEILETRPSEPFVIDTEEKVLWALAKIAAYEGQVKEIDNSAQVAWAHSIIRNSDDLRNRAIAKREKFIDRFGPELAEFAKTQFKGKEKTYRTLLGAISLRSVAAKLKVVNAAAALEWAKKECPDAVKTETRESFLVSKLTVDPLMSSDLDAKLAFELEPAKESISIKTGVE